MFKQDIFVLLFWTETANMGSLMQILKKTTFSDCIRSSSEYCKKKIKNECTAWYQIFFFFFLGCYSFKNVVFLYHYVVVQAAQSHIVNKAADRQREKERNIWNPVRKIIKWTAGGLNLGQSSCHLFHPNPHIYRYVIMTFWYKILHDCTGCEAEDSPKASAAGEQNSSFTAMLNHKFSVSFAKWSKLTKCWIWRKSSCFSCVMFLHLDKHSDSDRTCP